MEVSNDVKKLNPGLFGSVGGLPKPKLKQSAKGERKSLEVHGAKKGRSKSVERRPTVTICSFRQKLLSDETDSFAAGCKYLRDAIAKSIGLDDADEFIEWKYYQTKVEKRSEEGTLVKIEI